MTYRYNHCRFCKKFEAGDNHSKLVKYGTRHWAHHRCYLDAGKTLESLHAWQVGEFPFRLLRERGLTERAEQIIAKDVAERVHRLAEEGRRP